MIIGGGLSAYTLLSMGAVVEMLSYGSDFQLSALIVVAIILMILSVTLCLATGIIGVKTSEKPDKAQLCITFGIITIAFSTAVAIFAAIISAPISIIDFIVGLILPILYLIGAFQNKKLYLSEKTANITLA